MNPSMMSCMTGGGCAHGAGLGIALMAATAVLGWWALARAEKDGGPKRVVWAGRVVGWLLLAGGLTGFLCASWAHAFKGARACRHELRPGLPPGHPPLNPGG